MTKEREALKLALQTLEICRVFVMSHEVIDKPKGADWYDNRINAIKEALAQSLPVQGLPTLVNRIEEEKPWVNLTVDELIDLEHKHLRHEDLVRAIKAKLKEKNTKAYADRTKAYADWNKAYADWNKANAEVHRIEKLIKEKNT